MTKEEYAARVEDVAVSFLSEHNAKSWKQEHEAGRFSDFMEEVEYSGGFHSHIDCHCASEWKEAVAVLEATGQDPDHVDSGLYDGCDWKKILVVIAFEVFSWDVREKAEELFDDDQFGEAIVPIKNTSSQWGFFPNLKTFRIPKGPWIVEYNNFIKILERRDSTKHGPAFSVVFEGTPEKHGSFYRVPCRRVYVQHKQHIDDAMKRCFDEFGVKEEPQRRRR